MKVRPAVRAVQYLLALLVVAIIIFPVYWIVVSSLKPPEEVLTTAPTLLPHSITLDNYVNAIEEYDILHYFKNSLIVTLCTVFLSVLFASLCSYAVMFLRFGFAKYITASLYILQMLPTVVMLVPLFVLYNSLGLLNTYASLILTYTASVSGVPIAIILLCGYFTDIPRELFEAAHIDGAGSFQAFCRILLPLATPGLICSAIYVFVVTWQEFMFASNLITDSAMYTMPVGLTMFVSERTTDWGGMMAAATMIAVPSVALFVSVQNYFIDNLAGSVKE